MSYESNESGQPEVYLRPFNRSGAAVRVSTNGGTQARWSHKGGELFYLSPSARLMAVTIRPSADGSGVSVGTPVELFESRIYRGGTQMSLYKFQYAVAPDGRFLINEAVADDVSSPLIVALNWWGPATK